MEQPSFRSVDLDSPITLSTVVKVLRERSGQGRSPVGARKLLSGIQCADEALRLRASLVGNRYLVTLRNVYDWISRQLPPPVSAEPSLNEQIQRDAIATFERHKSRRAEPVARISREREGE